MTLSEMRSWANTPRPGRLRVELEDHGLLHYYDMEAHQCVTVHIPHDDPFNVEMTVNTNTSVAFPRVGNVKPIKRIGDAQHFIKGEGIAQRDVYHYVSRKDAKTLRVGLTVHRAAFSSTPHPFEMQPEEGFEEVFMFLLPDGGKGILECEGMWPAGGTTDSATPVRDRQLAQVPMGWHRVTALADAAGVPPRLGYIWSYLCLFPTWEKDLD